MLATLDTVSLDAALASAKAQLEAAETTAANDGSESSTQRAANDASLASADADVVQAEDNLDAATLRATFTGTVASVDIAVGDQAGSSSSSARAATGQGATRPLTTIDGAPSRSVDPTTFVVDADVAADDITQVKKGLQVQITPTGATDADLRHGQGGRAGRRDQHLRRRDVPGDRSVTGAQERPLRRHDGRRLDHRQAGEDVLTVPTLALTHDDGKTYVNKVDGSSTKKTAVTVGETYGASTEIKKGLKAGDKVEITTPSRCGRTADGNGRWRRRRRVGGRRSRAAPRAATFPGGGGQ